MKHLFVPYELALLAKEKGFNEPCLAYLEIHPNDQCIVYYKKPYWDERVTKSLIKTVSAPIYQQLVDWFEQEHDLIFSPNHRRNGNVKNYWYAVNKFEKSPAGVIFGVVGMIKIGCHLSDKSALNSTITEAFKLI